ncbi:heparinase II/III domain-containing protein [Paenibacillus cymbidii]|uniref:heparinase II/III domain-containing protein n=1 Tax=Paenibacillus cymbidii TaxID=1639034 RepID=UPI00107FE4EB|nr:heparinase II/III family protein [Paenibacillus cymbidii]
MISFRDIRRELAAAQQRSPLFPFGLALDKPLFDRLRHALHLQPLLAEIRREAERARTTPTPPLTFTQFHTFEQTGTRLEYEQPYFERRGRLLALTLATRIDDTPLYKEALDNLVWEICNEYTWCLPACLPPDLEACRAYRVPPEQVVDLFAAETANALAETLFLAGDRLDPWLVYRVRTEIDRRVFRPLYHDPVHFDWESRIDNWAAVCGGAVGMAALLLEEDRGRLAGMIERTVRALECFLDGYGDDGGSPEGLAYWQYGFGYYVYFADMLAQYTGGALDLLQGEKLRHIASFPAAFVLSGNGFVNYSDAGPCQLHTGLLSRLAARVGCDVPELREVPPFKADQCYRWPHVTRNLLWTDAALLGKPAPAATYVLPDLAVVVDRGQAGGTTVAFSAKGGHNGESHNHNDLGHFILHLGGDNPLADLGAGLYTKDYFGPNRYQLLHNASDGHSVPLINGRQQREGRQHEAVMLRNDQADGALHVDLDLTRAYDDPQLLQFRRSFVWTRHAATLRLTDTFEFAGSPASLEERFISLHKPELRQGAIVWTVENGEAVMAYDCSRFEAAVDTIVDVPGHNGALLTVYRTILRAIRPDAAVEAVFEFALKPRQATRE